MWFIFLLHITMYLYTRDGSRKIYPWWQKLNNSISILLYLHIYSKLKPSLFNIRMFISSLCAKCAMLGNGSKWCLSPLSPWLLSFMDHTPARITLFALCPSECNICMMVRQQRHDTRAYKLFVFILDSDATPA